MLSKFFSSNTFRSFSIHKKSLLLSSKLDHSGILKSILDVFHVHQMNITHIESHPTSTLNCKEGNTFILNFEYTSDSNEYSLMRDLDARGIIIRERLVKQVDWFPRCLKDLDGLDQKTLSAGSELECDHPGFKDLEYRKRRTEIAQVAFSHNCSDKEVPTVQYTNTEVETWTKVFDVLSPLHERYACQEYLDAVNEMKKECGFRRDNIPQIQHINEYLGGKTGFRLIPIAGLLSGRDFLNYLAFRVFASTQYIRHHSVPFYTPEPDIIHELIGHAPLFANQAFADFSQQIGLASLGASDDDIKKLATCYWFSIEFGLISEQNKNKKVYGAGVLSSVDEILNSVSNKPEFRFFDPFKACIVDYPITTLQPIYFWSNSFQEAKEMMNKYASKVDKGFTVAYDKEKHEIKVYQNIEIMEKGKKVKDIDN